MLLFLASLGLACVAVGGQPQSLMGGMELQQGSEMMPQMGIGGLRGFYGADAGARLSPSLMGAGGLDAMGMPGMGMPGMGMPGTGMPGMGMPGMGMPITTERTMSTERTTYGGYGLNGLPTVSPDDAMRAFLANAQQYKQNQEQQEVQANGGEAEFEEDDAAHDDHDSKEDGAPEPVIKKRKTLIHEAVPKLQRYLAATDPMEYSSPTFSNPVATQFFQKLADKKTPATERIKMQRLVSSPYMFNQLGNPAYADPQLWSGLVSGAAVPYPMRTLMMAQRTNLPHEMALTGQSMSGMDKLGMAVYQKANAASARPVTPATPNHKARADFHRVSKLIRKLQDRNRRSMEPTPHHSGFNVLVNPTDDDDA